MATVDPVFRLIQPALRTRLEVVHRQLRSHVAFSDPAVAAAEPEAPPERFSRVLSHRLFVRLCASISRQDRRQLAIDRPPFGLGFDQEIAETQHQGLLAEGQDLQGAILRFDGFSFLPESFRGRS